MIIKQVTIRNFRSYYGERNIEISPGLTLFVGGNGDGKTTFFEALHWLFDTTDTRPNLSHFSAVRKNEMELGETEIVKVAMTFNHGGEKQIEKSFRVVRFGTGDDDFKVQDFQYKGKSEVGSERVPVDGKNLMDACFDAFMQRLSMFQGESRLDVINDPVALKRLIDTYSDLKNFDEIVEYSKNFEEKSKKALDKENESDKRTSKKAKEINEKRAAAVNKRNNYDRDIKENEDKIRSFDNDMAALESNQEASTSLRDLKDRLESKRQDLVRQKGARNNVNLNTALLDRFWALCAFTPILKEYQAKCANYSKTKRRMQDDYLKEQAKKEGKQQALNEVQAMLKGATQLRWDIPDQATMEEMIEEHICKVCGHPAPEGSPEYNFMVARLEELKKHNNPTEPEKVEPLFKNDYIDALQTLSNSLCGYDIQQVTNVPNQIRDRLGLNASFDKAIRKLEDEIKDLEDEKGRILIQAPGLTEDMLEQNFRNYQGRVRLKSDAEKAITDLKISRASVQREIEDLDKQMDELTPSTGMAKVYKDVHDAFELIRNAFSGAKERNLTDFLKNLEARANGYLSSLNTEDFHGVIKLIRTPDGSASVRLYSEDGDLVRHPSGSQETTMYMSILFAVSELTTIKKNENYPLIFDAPTSSFDATKEKDFYNIVDTLNKQCIIFTKDFMNGQELDEDLVKGLSCKVYGLKKAAGFIPGKLSTIRTIIKDIQ